MKNCIPLRNMNPIENEDLRKEKVDETKYKYIIGNLLYLSIYSGSDIIYPVSKTARRGKEPSIEDWNNVIKTLRYLKSTLSLFLTTLLLYYSFDIFEFK